MSAKEVHAIIDRMKKIEFVPGLKNVTGSYRFDVEDVGSWRVQVDHGRVAVEDAHDGADCTVRVQSDDFARIMSGAQNLVTAWMQGLVEVEGDLALAQKLHGVLPSQGGKRS